jgi:hypothetical protein
MRGGLILWRRYYPGEVMPDLHPYLLERLEMPEMSWARKITNENRINFSYISNLVD